MSWLPRLPARASTSKVGLVTSGMVLLAAALTSCTTTPGTDDSVGTDKHRKCGTGRDWRHLGLDRARCWLD